MILVDTGVIIGYQRTGDPKLDALFRSLPVGICGVTRAEILHGARDSANRHNLLILLNTFHQVSIPDSIWDLTGDHLAALRAKGITVPFADVVIATLAIQNDIELWTRDAHFTMIRNVLPILKLFVEPP